eukprot:COSAG06_NODE_6829_length_2754_cov_903.616949_2_plen_206_part_00
MACVIACFLRRYVKKLSASQFSGGLIVLSGASQTWSDSFMYIHSLIVLSGADHVFCAGTSRRRAACCHRATCGHGRPTLSRTNSTSQCTLRTLRAHTTASSSTRRPSSGTTPCVAAPFQQNKPFLQSRFFRAVSSEPFLQSRFFKAVSSKPFLDITQIMIGFSLTMHGLCHVAEDQGLRLHDRCVVSQSVQWWPDSFIGSRSDTG